MLEITLEFKQAIIHTTPLGDLFALMEKMLFIQMEIWLSQPKLYAWAQQNGKMKAE